MLAQEFVCGQPNKLHLSSINSTALFTDVIPLSRLSCFPKVSQLFVPSRVYVSAKIGVNSLLKGVIPRPMQKILHSSKIASPTATCHKTSRHMVVLVVKSAFTSGQPIIQAVRTKLIRKNVLVNGRT
jgi:hypothetical protein